jgi:hypothetical protein
MCNPNPCLLIHKNSCIPHTCLHVSYFCTHKDSIFLNFLTRERKHIRVRSNACSTRLCWGFFFIFYILNWNVICLALMLISNTIGIVLSIISEYEIFAVFVTQFCSQNLQPSFAAKFAAQFESQFFKKKFEKVLTLRMILLCQFILLFD